MFKTYSAIVKHPISLYDIKEKIGKFLYVVTTDFLNDIRLMVYNAFIFNPPDSEIVKTGYAFLQTAKDLLTIEKVAHGRDNNKLRVLEEVIVSR